MKKKFVAFALLISAVVSVTSGCMVQDRYNNRGRHHGYHNGYNNNNSNDHGHYNDHDNHGGY